jgi:hypothetical protein
VLRVAYLRLPIRIKVYFDGFIPGSPAELEVNHDHLLLGRVITNLILGDVKKVT